MNNSIKGLIIKDLKLMKNQKQFIIIIIMVCLLQIFYISNIFIIYFISIICSSLILGTISYDAFNNGLSYLFTLPISRKDYIREKYILLFLLTITSWFIINIAFLLSIYLRKDSIDITEHLIISTLALPISWVIAALEIPVQIKFGSESNRIVTLITIMVIGVFAWVVNKISSYANIDLSSIFNTIFNNNTISQQTIINISILSAVAIVLGIMYISYTFALKAIKKKEY